MGGVTTGAKARIQIVEDEWIVAYDIKNSLTTMGYAVTAIVDSGEDAVLRAAEDVPDLVLMDIVLRGAMDGIEAASEIRARYRIPVIFLTANADEGMLDRAKRTEPMGYLIKPFIDRELKSTIEMALHKHRVEMRLVESERKFRSLVENAADAFFVIDLEGSVMDVNTEACRALGMGREELLRLKLMDFDQDSNPGRIKDDISRTSRGESVTHRTTYLRSDGTSIHMEVRVGGFELEGRRMLIILARDISEQLALVRELQGALRKMNLLKSTIPLCALKKDFASEAELEQIIQAHKTEVLRSGFCSECLETMRQDLKRAGREHIVSQHITPE